jgi:hypothetical protein
MQEAKLPLNTTVGLLDLIVEIVVCEDEVCEPCILYTSH